MFGFGNKQTVHGEVVPDSKEARALEATRESDAEVLAVARHDRVNLIWEYTQAYLASVVITLVLLASVYVAIWGVGQNKSTAVVFMSGLANLIAGFYFGRTNHTRPTEGAR